MNNPEQSEPKDPKGSKDSEKFTESAEVLRQIGSKLYNQCLYYTKLFESRPLVESDDQTLTLMYNNQLLRDFHKSTGEYTSYKNNHGVLLSVTRREGHEGVLEFAVNNFSDDEASGELKGDYHETYLIAVSGDILAAERQETTADFTSGGETVIKPIVIDAESFMHKIDTEFRAIVPQPNDDSDEPDSLDDPTEIE